MKVSKTTILSGIACLGVVGTGVASFFAGRKSSKYLDDESLTRQEKLKRVLLYNVPSFITGGGTIFLIAMSNRLSLKTEKRLTAALVTSAELANMSLDELKSKCSEKEYKETIEHLKKRIEDMHQNGETLLFKLSDSLGGEYFEATYRDVCFAIVEILEHFVTDGDATINTVRTALGFDWDPKYDNDGWSCCQEIFILPFDIGEVDGAVNEDGLHYTSFEPVYAPEDLSKYDY